MCRPLSQNSNFGNLRRKARLSEKIVRFLSLIAEN